MVLESDQGSGSPGKAGQGNDVQVSRADWVLGQERCPSHTPSSAAGSDNRGLWDLGMWVAFGLCTWPHVSSLIRESGSTATKLEVIKSCE